MDRRKFIITTAGVAGGLGVYTYSTTPKLSVASPKPVETPNIPKPLNSNEYFDIPINPFEIQGQNLSTSNDITINYEIRRVSDDSSVSTATESVNVPSSGSFTVNTKGRKLRLRNSDLSGGSEDFYIHITISHPDTGTLDAQSAGFTVKESGAYFNVSITGSSSPVDEGNTLTVDYEVENTGTESDTQIIGLDVEGSQRDSNSETVASGDTVTGSLSWNTSSGDSGDYTATVSSSETSDSVSVSVESTTVARSDAIALADVWYEPKSDGTGFTQIANNPPSEYPSVFEVNPNFGSTTFSADYFGSGLDALKIGNLYGTIQTKIYDSSDTVQSDNRVINVAQYNELTGSDPSSGFTSNGVCTVDSTGQTGFFYDGCMYQYSIIDNSISSSTCAGGDVSSGSVTFSELDRIDGTQKLSGSGFSATRDILAEDNIYLNTGSTTPFAQSEFAVVENSSGGIPQKIKDYFNQNYNP